MATNSIERGLEPPIRGSVKTTMFLAYKHIMMEDRVQSASQIVKDHDKHLAKRDQEKFHTVGTNFCGSGHTLRTSCR